MSLPRALLLTLTLLSVAYGSFDWTWDRLQVFTYGTNTTCCPFNGTNAHCCSGIDSPEELSWKSQYDVALVDNELTSPGCINPNTGITNSTKCNDFKAQRAADLKAQDPSLTTFVYRGGPFGCRLLDDQSADPDAEWFDALSNVTRTLKSTWLVDRNGVLLPGQCDFRKAEAQNFWISQHIMGPEQRWVRDSSVDGMFSDSGLIMGWSGASLNITVGVRAQLFNATCVTMRRMAQVLQDHGKVLTFSLKDHFSSIKKTGGGSSGGTLCDPSLDPSLPVQGHDCFPYGEEVLFELMGNVTWIPFREFNIPSRDFGKDNITAQWDGCAAAIEDFALEAQRAAGAFACNNDGAINATLFPSPYGNLSFEEQHQMSLAAFMLGMERGSYFGSGMHWDDRGWHVWWPEYGRALGAPLAKFKRDGYVFKRSFAHMDVSADCQTLRANFTWHDTPPTEHTGSLRVPRTNGEAASVRHLGSDIMLFAGGYTDSLGKVKTPVVDVYNATSNQWSSHNMSTGRTLFASSSLGPLAMFGCGETDSVQSETDSVDVWNASDNSWSLMRLSQARKKCSATAVELQVAPDGQLVHGKVLFAGGWPLGGHAPTDRVDIYDYHSGAWTTASLSVSRMYMMASSSGPYAAFAGGLAVDGDSAQVDVFDARTGSWKTTTLVQGLREGNAVGLQSTMLFYGANHVQLYRPTTNTWIVRNHSAEWAKMGAAVVAQNYAVFAGGVGCPANDCAVMEVFDEKRDVWYTPSRKLKMARQYLMGAGGRDLAVFAGGINNTHQSTTATDFISLDDLRF